MVRKKLTKSRLMKIAGCVFALVGILHIARIFFHYDMVIAGYFMPEWLSLLAGLLLVTLSVLILKN